MLDDIELDQALSRAASRTIRSKEVRSCDHFFSAWTEMGENREFRRCTKCKHSEDRIMPSRSRA